MNQADFDLADAVLDIMIAKELRELSKHNAKFAAIAALTPGCYQRHQDSERTGNDFTRVDGTIHDGAPIDGEEDHGL